MSEPPSNGFGGDTIIRTTVGTQTSLSVVLADHLGSPSVAFDPTGVGTVTGTRLHEPYGQVRHATGVFAGDRGYTGQQADPSGLSYYGARYCSPTLMRFVSADTIVPDPSSIADLNRYAYVRGNPVLYTDPSGHALWNTQKVDGGRCWSYTCGGQVAARKGEIAQQRMAAESQREGRNLTSTERMDILVETHSNKPLHEILAQESYLDYKGMQVPESPGLFEDLLIGGLHLVGTAASSSAVIAVANLVTKHACFSTITLCAVVVVFGVIPPIMALTNDLVAAMIGEDRTQNDRDRDLDLGGWTCLIGRALTTMISRAPGLP